MGREVTFGSGRKANFQLHARRGGGKSSRKKRKAKYSRVQDKIYRPKNTTNTGDHS